MDIIAFQNLQTTQFKLLRAALELTRQEIVDIIALGGITVSKNRVDTWLRGQNSSKIATGNSHMAGKRTPRAHTIEPNEFTAFCAGLKPWLESKGGNA